jgi:hypothetical protein
MWRACRRRHWKRRRRLLLTLTLTVRPPLVHARSQDERVPEPARPGLPCRSDTARLANIWLHTYVQFGWSTTPAAEGRCRRTSCQLYTRSPLNQPARICVACCILRGPTPVPRAILDASQPLHDWAAMTPCGRRAGGAPARCLPEIGSTGGPAAVATPTLAPAAASVADPIGDLSRLPRPSIREIMMNELRAPELWTDLLAELRKRVARLMRKLL